MRKPLIVKERSVEYVTSSLPMLENLSMPVGEFDVLILAAGFEERVLAIPQILLEQKCKIRDRIILGHYETNIEDNLRRELVLKPILEKISKLVVALEADNPKLVRDTIHANVQKTSDQTPEILLDISGASSTFIFSSIAAIASLSFDVNLTIGYTSAAEYHDPGSDRQAIPVAEWTLDSLRETGVRDVVTNELYRGIHHDHLPGFVIALPSMYTPRLQRCLSHLGVGPLSGAKNGSVFWILPRTEDPRHMWRQDSIIQSLGPLVNEDNSSNTQIKTNSVACDVFDYISCLRIIIEQVDSQEGANTSLIHMGTKIQAVGVAIAILARTEVSLVSSRPEAFSAKDYSKGIGSTHQIKLGSIKDIISKLEQVGTLEVRSGGAV